MEAVVRTTRVLLLLLLLEAGHGERMLQSLALQSLALQSLAYASYTGQQIFYMLNWQSNDRLIQQINSDSASTFQVGHNRFSYLSLAEINENYLGLNVQPLSQMKVPNR